MSNPPVTPKRLLRFGIPSLDRLLAPPVKSKWEGGIALRSNSPSTARPGTPLDLHISMCIIGPSGTGKSLLALHLASRYWADCRLWARTAGDSSLLPHPRILYLSTDLGFNIARATWRSFGLDKPNDRPLPFGEQIPLDPSGPPGQKNWAVDLERYQQEKPGELAKFLTVPQTNDSQIAFVDLAEATAGDDWAFVTRLTSLLSAPKGDEPHHLLIIDAVEGLEMLTGETDSFGQQRSRRSRIAQILRTAAEKCHVVLILEEDDAHKHPPEEYVTDLVIRLRVEREMAYLRRSIEIVKARGQALIRGEHHYLIRGASNTADCPRYRYPDDPLSNISYIQVVRSLHSLSRVMMCLEGDEDAFEIGVLKPSGEFTHHDLACFSTPKFGSILPKVEPFRSSHGPQNFQGLIRSCVTSLIGDEATLKSRLGRAFLAGAFYLPDTAPEVAVLLTTFNVDQKSLAHQLEKHATHDMTGRLSFNPADRLICRQLEVHHFNSTLLFHVIRRCVEAALVMLEKLDGKERAAAEGSGASGEKDRAWCFQSRRAGRVRVVIDDWAVIQATHAKVASDSLFLPFLIKYFQRVGVTALIISTQSGKPDEILKTTSDHQLRALADYHLFTWHVPFYGTDRVAITAMPSMVRSQTSFVGELREARTTDGAEPETCGERLWIDPHFELYKGLDSANPCPVPLEVRLFSGSPGFSAYSTLMRGLLDRLFGGQGAGPVLMPEDRADYTDLRDFSILHGDTHRDHTIVIQVDEYWKEANSLVNEQANVYLQQRTVSSVGSNAALPSPTTDPFRLFQRPMGLEHRKITYKHQFFHVPGYSLKTCAPNPENPEDWIRKVPGIPYVWDFGFLLLRVRAWKGAIKNIPEQKKRTLIKTVFDALSGDFGNPEPPNEEAGGDRQRRETVSWRDFFDACQAVASWNNRPHWPTICPFDLDMLTPQSFACLVLEIWASELRLMGATDLATKAFPSCRHEPREERDFGIVQMLSGRDKLLFRKALFRTWLLLAEVVDSKELTTGMHRLVTRPAPHAAAAERHWYSTGSQTWRDVGGDNPVIPARLPGNYTARGDWFLLVGKESRSQRLGERAIDLLCRRRANLERLEAGMGLPVRRLNSESWEPDHCNPYSEILTAIANFERGGRRRIVRYGDFLRNLGALDPGPVPGPGPTQPGETATPQPDPTACETASTPENGGNDGRMKGNADPGKLPSDDTFQWLWRSRILDYHRHDRAWENWLGRLLVESCKNKSEIYSQFPMAPFTAYDVIQKDDRFLDGQSAGHGALQEEDETFPFKSSLEKAWKKFQIRCDALVSELKQQSSPVPVTPVTQVTPVTGA